MTSRMIIDLAMVIDYLILIDLRGVGLLWHMVLGILFFILVFIHQKLNFSWYRSLRRGRWTKVRIFSALVNLLLICSFLVVFAGGIFLLPPIRDNLHILNIGLAHAVAGHIMIFAIGLHLGLHVNAIVPRIKRSLHWPKGTAGTVLTAVFVIAIATLGIYFTMDHAFIARVTADRQAIRMARKYTSVPLYVLTSFFCVLFYAEISHYITKLLRK
jgi:hypothetical protein